MWGALLESPCHATESWLFKNLESTSRNVALMCKSSDFYAEKKKNVSSRHKWQNMHTCANKIAKQNGISAMTHEHRNTSKNRGFLEHFWSHQIQYTHLKKISLNHSVSYSHCINLGRIIMAHSMESQAMQVFVKAKNLALSERLRSIAHEVLHGLGSGNLSA